MSIRNYREWQQSGLHLPPFLRDFHAQKRLFKWLDRAASAQNATNEPYNQHPDFKTAMCYTIDIFLWIMAAHGYTLQRTRQRVEGLGDLQEALSNFDAWQAEHFRQMWEAENAKQAQAERPGAEGETQ